MGMFGVDNSNLNFRRIKVRNSIKAMTSCDWSAATHLAEKGS